MIVPMKKVTILSLAVHRDATLNALRDLGVVHLKPFQPPAGGDLENARRACDEAQSALALLERLGVGAQAAAQPPAPADELLRKILLLAARRHDRAEHLQRLAETIRQLEPYGDFDPAAVRELAGRGVSIRLFKSEPRAKLAFPENAIQLVLRREKNAVYFALVNGGDWSTDKAIERPIPERALGVLRQERRELESAQARNDEELTALAPYRASIAASVAVLADRLHWLEAREGMAHEGPLLFLQGYMPESNLPDLQAEARRQGWGWEAVDPSGQDEPPTLIKSARVFRPIEAMFDMLGILPGYREVDISPVFLVFFSLFFAMLVGDAVYGLFFLGMTALIRKKWKTAPRNLVPLLGILSVATIVWGVLTGSYLGFENLPAPLNRVKIDWLTDPVKIQTFCFLVGAIHMTLAHGWNILRQIRSVTALSHLGWIGCCWTMFGMANYLVLGLPLMPGLVPLFSVSVALILLFTVPFSQIKKEYTSLLTLPLSIIGNFGDVVSYLRLYLVGSASAVLVKAFNSLAFGDGPSSLIATLIGSLIIFAVHILNILLSALAVLVHGVRLNALEFSTHMGIQWLGRKYAPFRRHSPNASIQQPERTNP